MRNHKPESTDKLITGGLPQQIQQRAMAISRLNKALHGCLPGDAANHCRIANFRDGILVIEAESPSWGMRLNFERINLISALRAGPLPSLMSIEVKVNPTVAKPVAREEKQANPRKISDTAAAYLKMVAENAPDKVKERLEAIAALAERKNGI
ncbi:DciA family protein [Parasalinivibrio latis]|uniref:DUF721 domain-containing protein n=1 Tax=Parasalinivibrio latis TaxID=2952610 RepID=UPI0030E5BA12